VDFVEVRWVTSTKKPDVRRKLEGELTRARDEGKKDGLEPGGDKLSRQGNFQGIRQVST